MCNCNVIEFHRQVFVQHESNIGPEPLSVTFPESLQKQKLFDHLIQQWEVRRKQSPKQLSFHLDRNFFEEPWSIVAMQQNSSSQFTNKLD